MLGQLEYSPDLNFNGSDSFTYQANDGTARQQRRHRRRDRHRGQRRAGGHEPRAQLDVHQRERLDHRDPDVHGRRSGSDAHLHVRVGRRRPAVPSPSPRATHVRRDAPVPRRQPHAHTVRHIHHHGHRDRQRDDERLSRSQVGLGDGEPRRQQPGARHHLDDRPRRARGDRELEHRLGDLHRRRHPGHAQVHVHLGRRDAPHDRQCHGWELLGDRTPTLRPASTRSP